MTEAEVVDIVIHHMQGQFPRTCPTCGHRFETLRDYCLYTIPVGAPVVYDMETDDMKPRKPLGAVALSNCRCGTSLALSSRGMSLWLYWKLVSWAYDQVRVRGISREQLMQHLREQAHEKVIAASEGPAVKA